FNATKRFPGSTDRESYAMPVTKSGDESARERSAHLTRPRPRSTSCSSVRVIAASRARAAARENDRERAGIRRRLRERCLRVDLVRLRTHHPPSGQSGQVGQVSPWLPPPSSRPLRAASPPPSEP